MKLALVIVAIVVLLWLLKGAFTARRGAPPAPKRREAAPMLQCAECGLHLPRDEALPGKDGVYCSEAHRSTRERREA